MDDIEHLTFCSTCKSRLIDFDHFKRQCVENNRILSSRQGLTGPKQEQDFYTDIDQHDLSWEEADDANFEDCNSPKTNSSAKELIEMCFIKEEAEVLEAVAYVCDICGLQFSAKKSLKRHVDAKHLKKSKTEIKVPQIKKPLERKSLQCSREGCEKKFYRQDRLDAHLRIHEGKKVS